MLQRIPRMVDALCRYVGGRGIFRGFKSATASPKPVNGKLPHPFSSTLVKCHAQNPAGFIIGLAFNFVLFVYRAGYFSQIAYAAISRVVVNVVYFCRPNAMHVKPREPMSKPLFFQKLYVDIAVGTDAPCGFKTAHATSFFYPSKNTCFWVVMKRLAQTFCGNIGFSHDTVPSLIGQRLASVSALGGLRYFSAGRISWQ